MICDLRCNFVGNGYPFTTSLSYYDVHIRKICRIAEAQLLVSCRLTPLSFLAKDRSAPSCSVLSVEKIISFS